MSGAATRSRFGQAQIVLAIAVLAFGAFSALTPHFLSTSNVTQLIENVSILGILAMGMAISILGRGIDLSMVASMAVSVAWMLASMNAGRPFAESLGFGLLFSLAVGLVNGLLIAYVEVPPIFATLAMGTAIYGLVASSCWLPTSTISLPTWAGSVRSPPLSRWGFLSP